ncbi:MAG TPA: prolyl oligopeptidase family serine peptidase [Thermoanaerobaculaceae bacterium]|nr:prolyl oligopeptidase family serine peptidase [Thermoanaerobaculaceae bacterium]
MKVTRTTISAAAVSVLLLAGPAGAQRPQTTPRIAYPAARKGDVVDDYHGVKVADPYRWMEDLDSAETRAWVQAESALTESYMATIPARAPINKRLTGLWDYERFTVPFVDGGRTFFTRNSGLQAQNVLYVLDSPDAQPRVLLDPNTLSADGTVALSGTSVSNDGTLLAYSVSTAGSDWQEWRVRDVATAKDTADRIEWAKFTHAAWTHDGAGFFYGRFDQPPAGAERKATNYFQKLYYHKLGTPQSADPIVYRRDDHKEWQFSPEVSDDGRYLLIYVSVGTDRRNMFFYKDLREPSGKVVELLPELEANYSFVDNDGPVFFFRTDEGAPNGRLIAIDTANPARAAWRVIIPEAKDALVRVSRVHDTFIADYLKDATTSVRLFADDGKPLGEVKLPGLGAASGFGGKRTDPVTYYSFASFTAPGTIYRFDVASRTSTVFRQPKVAADLGAFETTQVFYTSKDGTRVPMFLTYRKGTKLDGTNPTLLYAYGGFDIPELPAFSVSNLVWMEMGGVYALANLRGGSEYGEAWHQAGMFERKQNVFDDFIAAAEWLIANRYTSRERLAIFGGSNGGLLIGAVLNQRPDLFGAAIPAVGVMDMLRFQKFTIGWAWASEYGTADDPKMFPALRAYSPLHNIKPGTCYPPTLVMTADHDDRVFPAHSFKYAATLQAAQACANPVLIHIETRAGHGAGKPTSKQIAEAADRLAFLVKSLGMPTPKFE